MCVDVEEQDRTVSLDSKRKGKGKGKGKGEEKARCGSASMLHVAGGCALVEVNESSAFALEMECISRQQKRYDT